MFRPLDKPIADGVAGTAQVVSVSPYAGKGVYQTCHMNLVVGAPNVTPLAVEFEGLVHNLHWPAIGSTLPISVSPKDPRKYAILWADVPNTREVARGHAEGIAAALRNEPDSLGQLVTSGLLGGGNVQVIGDLTALTESQKEKLRMFGIDLDALATAGASAAAGPAFMAAATSTGGDTVSQLERLGALRDRGVLTESEFAAQKAKLLG